MAENKTPKRIPKTNRRKPLSRNPLLLIGILMITAALALSTYNLVLDVRAGRESDRAVAVLMPEKTARKPAQTAAAEPSALFVIDPQAGAQTETAQGSASENAPRTDKGASEQPSIPALPAAENPPGTDPGFTTPTLAEIEIPDYILNPQMDMPTQTVGKYDYIGVLEIESLGLTLAVIDECTDAALKSAPCRYSGSAYLDNMVIAGHNFRRHFASLTSLHIGAGVVFTDIDGNEFSYRVADIETIDAHGITEMTESEWDLTLFTCNYSGQARIALRCERLK